MEKQFSDIFTLRQLEEYVTERHAYYRDNEPKNLMEVKGRQILRRELSFLCGEYVCICIGNKNEIQYASIGYSLGCAQTDSPLPQLYKNGNEFIAHIGRWPIASSIQRTYYARFNNVVFIPEEKYVNWICGNVNKNLDKMIQKE